jgi:hypothetical protein
MPSPLRTVANEDYAEANLPGVFDLNYMPSPKFYGFEKIIAAYLRTRLIKIETKNDTTSEDSGYQNSNSPNQPKRTQHAVISDVKFSV